MRKYVLILLMLLLGKMLSAQEVYKLDNGMTVILAENNKVPLATFQIWVKAGSITEENYAGAGISHYVEHLLFTDTKKQKGGDIAKFMKKMGCDMNGYTSFDRTVYHFTFPAENLYKIIPVAKEMIFDPGFKKDQIKKERNVILKEINMNIDDPNRFFNRLIFSSVYKESYYKFPIIGYEELFRKIERDDILAYYNRQYQPDNIALIAVGDFNKKKLKESIKKHYGKIKREIFQPNNIITEPNQAGYQEAVKYRKDIKVSKIALCWKTVDLLHKDLFSLDVLSMMLGRGQSSILSTILKDKEQLVSSISSSSYTPMTKGVFVIEAELNPGVSADKVKKRIIDIVFNIKKHISKKKLEKIKYMALRDYYKNKETINSYAGDLGVNWASSGNINFSKYYADGLKKVKKREIETIIKKYFVNHNLTYIQLLPDQLKIKKDKEQQKKDQDNTSIIKLKNGLRIVLHQNRDLPFINIAVACKGGVLFEPKDKKGLTLFLSKMLLGGTKKYKRDKLISLIEEKGGNIYPFAGNNSFGLSMEIFKENLPTALKLLNEVLYQCSFPKKEITRARLEILQQIKHTRQRLFGVGKEILFRAMYSDYAYSSLNIGDEKSIKRIKRSDLKKYYKEMITPDNTVLSIAGDFDVQSMKKDVAKSLNKWWSKYKGSKETAFQKKDIKKEEILEKIDKKQSLFLLAYYGLSVRDKDRIMVDLLWQILNGQGSRLFVNLREKRELAYYTGMFPFYGLTTGLFVFYTGTVKDKLESSKKGMIEEIDILVKKGVTEKELNGAKKEFLSDKLKSFQANNSIAFDYALDILYNNKIIDINDYKKRVEKVSLTDINNFVKKYLSKPYKIIILEGQ